MQGYKTESLIVWDRISCVQDKNLSGLVSKYSVDGMMELDSKVTKNESDQNEERERATEEVKEKKNIAVIRNLDLLTETMSENSGSITRLLTSLMSLEKRLKVNIF